MNARLCKITRSRGQFPSVQAVPKVLYRAVRNIEDYSSPNVRIRSSGWKQALQASAIYFDGRILDAMTATKDPMAATVRSSGRTRSRRVPERLHPFAVLLAPHMRVRAAPT